MRRTAMFLLAGFALVSFFCIREARAADAVAVEPPFVTPGKPITLKWYFTGEKVLLSGGRFGKGVVVTGKSSISDTPRATTKYTFDVWYKIPAPKVEVPKVVDPKVADPKAVDPKVAPPKPADPRAADPKAAEPKAAEPKAVDPKVVDPKVAPPKATDPKVAEPKAIDPKVADPKVAAPKVADPKAADQKAIDPKAVDPKVVPPKPADPPVTAPKDPKAVDTKAADPKVVDPKAVDPKLVDPKAAEPKAAVAPQEMILKHVQYTTYAEVWSGVYPPMKAYRDPHGWQLSILNGWKHDSVPTAAEGSDGLNYFQQEDDSVERLAVAIIPTKNTADEVLNKISEDVYGHYQNAKLAEPVDLTVNSVPAKLLTFTGIDLSHPGTQTASVVLVFVRNGRSYVVSARSAAAHFNGRRPILEKLVRSFAFNK